MPNVSQGSSQFDEQNVFWRSRILEGFYNFKKSRAKSTAGITPLVPQFNRVLSGINVSPGSLQLDE